METPPGDPPSWRADSPPNTLHRLAWTAQLAHVQAFLSSLPSSPVAQPLLAYRENGSSFLHRLCHRGVPPSTLQIIAEKLHYSQTSPSLFALGDEKYNWQPLHLLAAYSNSLDAISIAIRESPSSLLVPVTVKNKTPQQIAEIYEPFRTNHDQILSLLQLATTAYQQQPLSALFKLVGTPYKLTLLITLRVTLLFSLSHPSPPSDPLACILKHYYVINRDVFSVILKFL